MKGIGVSNRFINLILSMCMVSYTIIQHAIQLRCSFLELVHNYKLVNELRYFILGLIHILSGSTI